MTTLGDCEKYHRGIPNKLSSAALVSYVSEQRVLRMLPPVGWQWYLIWQKQTNITTNSESLCHLRTPTHSLLGRSGHGRKDAARSSPSGPHPAHTQQAIRWQNVLKKKFNYLLGYFLIGQLCVKGLHVLTSLVSAIPSASLSTSSRRRCSRRWLTLRKMPRSSEARDACRWFPKSSTLTSFWTWAEIC